MPFDEEDNIDPIKKIGIKKASTQKSIFDKAESIKKPSYQDFENKVNQIDEKLNDYKSRAAELALSFKKILQDKTLVQNKNVFNDDIEKEVLTKMIALAVEINTDENEQEGMGSLGWITVLLKSAIYHRDRINTLEYSLLQAQKQLEECKKQIHDLKVSSGLDKKKISE